MMISTAAYSEYTHNGNTLLDECQSNDGAEKSFCLGYVLGVLDELPNACAPNGVTGGQTAKVVERYLEAHPENLHLSANSLIASAVVAAWPCK
jgi:hypothetical protein